MYKNILYGLSFTITIILLSFLYVLNKSIPSNFSQIIYLINKKYLFLSLCTLFFFHTFDNLRIFIIARTIGLNYPFLYGYIITLINSFGATVTPYFLGGELLLFYTLKRVGGEIYQIMYIATLKCVAGIFFYVIFLPFTIHSILNNPKEAKEIISLLFIIILIAAILFTLWKLFFKKGTEFINKEILRSVKYTISKYFTLCHDFFKQKKKVFLIIFIFTLFMYNSLLLTGVFLVKAFNEKAFIKKIFLAQLPLFYAIFMSPTPGGSGIGEIGALSIFDNFIGADFLGIFAILWRIITQYLSAIIGGGLFLMLIMKDAYKGNV
jgi:uncharacterized protein (TIRG00374 family)